MRVPSPRLEFIFYKTYDNVPIVLLRSYGNYRSTQQRLPNVSVKARVVK